VSEHQVLHCIANAAWLLAIRGVVIVLG